MCVTVCVLKFHRTSKLTTYLRALKINQTKNRNRLKYIDRFSWELELLGPSCCFEAIPMAHISSSCLFWFSVLAWLHRLRWFPAKLLFVLLSMLLHQHESRTNMYHVSRIIEANKQTKGKQNHKATKNEQKMETISNPTFKNQTNPKRWEQTLTQPSKTYPPPQKKKKKNSHRLKASVAYIWGVLGRSTSWRCCCFSNDPKISLLQKGPFWLVFVGGCLFC